MEWCRLYASLDSDPRVQAAEDAAECSAWLLVQSMMYCTTAETAGFIPRTQVARFGGRNLDQRVKALVSEDIWIPGDRGYRLNPDLWSEERNLSDQAERKRARDRERMAAKRAAARLTQDDVSRDSRATVSGDSRPLEERRVVKDPPLTPPRTGGNRSRCKKHQRPRAGCEDCQLPPLVPVPAERCGRCNPSWRIEDADGNDIGPCPDCHPASVNPPEPGSGSRRGVTTTAPGSVTVESPTAQAPPTPTDAA